MGERGVLMQTWRRLHLGSNAFGAEGVRLLLAPGCMGQGGRHITLQVTSVNCKLCIRLCGPCMRYWVLSTAFYDLI